MTVKFSKLLCIGVVLAGIYLTGCGNSATPPLTATVTLKRDGSHFFGTVVSREGNSITVTGQQGDTHTFLYTELADLKYGPPDPVVPDVAAPATPQVSTGKAGGAQAVAGGSIQFPQGTEFPVRSSGFIDSCCVPENGVALGVIDADIKNQSGATVVPAGASVTMTLLENRKADGRISLKFELGSADFGGRHYIISSVKGGLEPSARVSFTGAKDGTQEAKERGLNVHLEDQAFMAYKAETPVVFKLSQ